MCSVKKMGDDPMSRMESICAKAKLAGQEDPGQSIILRPKLGVYDRRRRRRDCNKEGYPVLSGTMPLIRSQRDDT